MRRLLKDFDALFDLSYRVGATPLEELVERNVSALGEPPSRDWGSEGRREERVSESGRFVSFYYRPHLFPGMDLKLRLAHELQFHLLPRELPPGAPVSIAAVLESYCHLSGDLFGWEMLRDGRFLIWIVDIAGHGVRSGLVSAVLRVLIDNLRERGRTGALVEELNRGLHGCLRPEHDGLFATGFFLVLDRDGRAVYSSAAHPPILMRRAGGGIEELRSLDRPIGLFPDTTYRSREIRLEPGDCVLLYTDGLVEATGRDGEAFGVGRLRGLFATELGHPTEWTRAIYDEICRRQDIDKLEDDVTFLAAKL